MTEITERPKRLSLSQVLELVLTKSSGPGSSSVTVSRARDGEATFEVIGRLADGQSLAELELEVTAVFDSLEARYPSSSGDVSKGDVDLTRNAKGETQIGVSVSSPSVADAYQGARQVYDSARSTYPLASGLVGADPKGGA